MFKQNNFSRSLANDKKMGAYYTDTAMCRRIGKLLRFPEEEVSVLEPSCGDLTALEAVLGSRRNFCKVFGIELNTRTYQEVRERADYILNEDFLTGIKISHNSFGFCFANPPYGEDEKHERLEHRFLEKLYPYMKSGAPIVYVVPYYVAINEKFSKAFMTRFKIHKFYRFDDDIYKQFQQVVLLGTKKSAIGVLRPEWEAFLAAYDEVEKVPYLPMEDEEVEEKDMLYAVPSAAETIQYFTTLSFDREEAGRHLENSSVTKMAERFMVKPYSSGAVGQPPVPLKKDLLYLLAVSGSGQGMVGSPENKDVHLQRGCAKVVTRSEDRESENSDSMVEARISSTQIILNIIQNDGTITELK